MTPVVIIDDTGKTGDLDVVRTRHLPSQEQHIWLDGRLREAERRGAKVIVLFHMPGLVNERHDPKVYLD